MARLRLWLVMIPLVAAGTEGASTLLDTFAPRRYETVELFSRSNATHHMLPLVAALGVALLICALVSFAATAQAAPGPPRLLFACLPPLVFTLQEHVEFIVGRGHVPWTLLLSPIFASGLLLQVPFAVAAYLLARLFVEVAVALRTRTAPRRSRRCSSGGFPRRDVIPPLPVVDGRRRTRG